MGTRNRERRKAKLRARLLADLVAGEPRGYARATVDERWDGQLHVPAAAEAGAGRLLPVLAARDDAIRESFERAFPRYVDHRVTSSNRDGWVSGTAAADLASLLPRRVVGAGA